MSTRKGPYLRYEDITSYSLTKTSVLRVWSGDGRGTPLGSIKWYSPWRRYVFYPADGTLFDYACLGEVREKISELMQARVGK